MAGRNFGSLIDRKTASVTSRITTIADDRWSEVMAGVGQLVTGLIGCYSG
ncbi:hypothetical protein ACN4EK_06480 [Pantanalinema rosaneae CENA516]